MSAKILLLALTKIDHESIAISPFWSAKTGEKIKVRPFDEQ